MTVHIPVAMASINGSGFYPAEIRFDETVQHIRSENAVRPDPAWEHTDSSGHFHAFAEDGKTPTLTPYTVHVDCDGSCGGVCEGEGYDETHRKCAICGEEVNPGYIPDHETRTTGIPMVTSRWATVTVHGTGPFPQLGQRDNSDGTITFEYGVTPFRVTVRVRAGEDEMIGTGYVGPLSFARPAGWTVEIGSAQILPRLAPGRVAADSILG